MKPIALAAAVMAAMVFSAAPASAGPKHCPPGLAKKGACAPGTTATPPGHQKQTYHEKQTHYEPWTRWRDAGLRPAPSGQVYVLRNSEVVLMDESTRDVIRVIGAVSRLLN